MKLTPIFIDYETFWSKTHSLSKMPAVRYVMDPLTEIICVSIKVGFDGPTRVFFGEKSIRRHFETIDWDNALVIGHNMSGFDALIMSWRFGINPKMWGCTLAMARPVYAKICRLSLEALSLHLDLGVKNKTILNNTQGKNLKDFTPDELRQMAQYCADDSVLCKKLFLHLMKHTPPRELRQIDMTIRMATERRLQVDAPLLLAARQRVQQEKQDTMLALAKHVITPEEYMVQRMEGDTTSLMETVETHMASSAKFAALLTRLGAEVPMKPSPSVPGKMIPAVSKTDVGMEDLLEHEDPIVAMAAQCRLQVKSTLLETRVEQFLSTSQLHGGYLPVPLRYCGADTTGRWSGEVYNLQNLARINPKKPKNSDALRQSLIAPPGYRLVVRDLSGIELRVNHFLWKVKSSMDLYAGNREADLYRAFIAARYKITPEEVTKDQRQLGKVAQLGLGFGAGAPVFQRVAKLMSEGALLLSEKESADIVAEWRSQYKAICDGWKSCQRALDWIVQGAEREVDPVGLVHTTHAGLRLPSGRLIAYPELGSSPGESGRKDYHYGALAQKYRLHGPKVCENIVQALARDILADNVLEVRRQMDVLPCLMVHDELVYCVPAAMAEELDACIGEVMLTPPDYWPDIVLFSEGGVGERYSDAK